MPNNSNDNLDQWEIINGFDLFEADKNLNDHNNDFYSLDKWLLCGSWTMPFPSHRLDLPTTNKSINRNKEDELQLLSTKDVIENNNSNLISKNMRFVDSPCISSYSDSGETSSDSEYCNINSFENFKINRLYYDPRDHCNTNNVKYNNKKMYDNVKNYIPYAINEKELAPLKVLDEKLGKAFDKINYMESEAKNLLMHVSTSMSCLDELMNTTHRLKSNTGKFKLSCNRIMITEQINYYKCILFIIFGAGFALWAL